MSERLPALLTDEPTHTGSRSISACSAVRSPRGPGDPGSVAMWLPSTLASAAPGATAITKTVPLRRSALPIDRITASNGTQVRRVFASSGAAIAASAWCDLLAGGRWQSRRCGRGIGKALERLRHVDVVKAANVQD